MIRGILHEEGGRRRPFVVAQLEIADARASGQVAFLIDTGADATVLSPRDTRKLRINTAALPAGPPSTGVGGRMATVYAPATITLEHFTHDLRLRILVPTSPAQERALARIPSLLGRDILEHFGFFLELRTGRVVLLEPHETAVLPFR